MAAAIIHHPPVLFLDEPASGLDPEARHELSNLLITLQKEGMTILVSSHILAELADYSTDMLVLQNGQVVENKKLIAKHALDNTSILMEVGAEDSLEPHRETIRQISGVADVKEVYGKIQVLLDLQVTSKHQFLSTLISKSFKINDFSEVKINLQDEYIKTVQQFKENNPQ
jgi:ABC-2 type transport system ATP-binding protein